MQVDIGAFDLSIRVSAEADWLEPTADIAILNLRKQFQDNMDLISKNYQAMFAESIGRAITQHKMYFQTPDLNMANMSASEIEALKDLG